MKIIASSNKLADTTSKDSHAEQTPKFTPTSYIENMHAELMEMVAFATQRGKQLPSTITLAKTDNEKDLVANYNIMATSISPSTLQSIRYINSQILKKQSIRHWYSIPVFTKCSVIAFMALVSIIVISLFPTVNEANQAKGILSSQGLVLLYNLIFTCSASLLGVMFYLLKTISDKIKNYSLLPVDSIEANATILIGVISGFVIAELFSIETLAISSSVKFHKMTLALLGGFSSDAIFTLLQGVVKKMKQLIAPISS